LCFISISSDISINISSEEVEDSEEEEGDDTEEEGAEDDEDEDGDEDEDAVDEEEKSTDEGQAEGEGLSTATRPKRKQPLAADNSIQAAAQFRPVAGGRSSKRILGPAEAPPTFTDPASVHGKVRRWFYSGSPC